MTMTGTATATGTTTEIDITMGTTVVLMEDVDLMAVMGHMAKVGAGHMVASPVQLL